MGRNNRLKKQNQKRPAINSIKGTFAQTICLTFDSRLPPADVKLSMSDPKYRKISFQLLDRTWVMDYTFPSLLYAAV